MYLYNIDSYVGLFCLLFTEGKAEYHFHVPLINKQQGKEVILFKSILDKDLLILNDF